MNNDCLAPRPSVPRLQTSHGLRVSIAQGSLPGPSRRQSNRSRPVPNSSSSWANTTGGKAPRAPSVFHSEEHALPVFAIRLSFLHSTLSPIGDLPRGFHEPCLLPRVRFILNKTVIMSPAITKQSGSTRYRSLGAQSRALPSANQALSACKASDRCCESCLLPMCVHGQS